VAAPIPRLEPSGADRGAAAPRVPLRLATYGALAAVLLLVTIVYWPGMTGGFVFDDYSNLVFNTSLHVRTLHWSDWVAAILSSPATDLQRPLAMFTFALNHYFTGLDPWPMKVSNLFVHLFNTCLVFGMVRCLFAAALPDSGKDLRDRLALFVSACWALMPINLMAVLLIVQRMESLSHTFVFAGLWLYLVGRLRQRRGRNGWSRILAGVIAGTAFGALSKESAVLLPLYAFCIELCIFRFRRSDGGRDRGLMAFFGCTLFIPAVLGVAWLLPGSLDPATWTHRNFDLGERLLTEPRVLLDYLRWTIVPNLDQLSLFHDDYQVSRGMLTPPATSLAGLALALLLACAWALRDRRALISLGILWFIGAQLLTATFIPLELVFEHRNYFASLGVCLVLADLLFLLPSAAFHRRLGGIVAAFLILFYGASTHLRAIEWSNPIRFAQTEATKHPDSPRATYHLAQALTILSDGKADSPLVPAAFAAFERARKVPNATIAPAQGALLLAAHTGRPLNKQWWIEIQHRLRTQPIGPQEMGALGSLTDCALARTCDFPPDEMIACFAAALSQGDNAEIFNIYGNYALNVLRDDELAERLWREASRLRPQEPEYVISLAKLMIALGRMDEARAQIDRLRTMGRMGQYESAAAALEARLASASASASASPQ
jgi:hypothetical protein